MKTWIIWAVRSAAAAVMALSGLVIMVMVLFKFNASMLAFGSLWLFGGLFAFPRMPGAWRRDKPSDKQIAYATKLGIDVPADATKGELSEMISSVTGR